MPHTLIEPQIEARAPHPSAYAALIIPFGAMSGYVQVAMAFLCTRFSLSVEDGALLIASGMLPHTWKFFWAPVVDTTLTRKQWYMISVVLCALGITAMSAIPMSKDNLLLLEAVIFLANFASTFLGMSVEGLMAHATPAHERGRVGGWFQAGNLGGSGLGGGAGLYMATHLPSPWMSGAALGVAFMVGALALRFVPEATREQRTGSLINAMGGVAVDFWKMIITRAGLLAAVLCLLPINTGAITNVLSQAEVGAKWGVGEDTIALVNGVMNGIISALGCLFGGWVCKRYNARWVYAVVALLMASNSVAMVLSPWTPVWFITYTLTLAFTLGMSYTAFTGFVLDTIGKGAAATKYNAFASLSNAPIAYMGLLLAWAQTNHQESGMLWIDAGTGVAGLVLLGIVALALRPRTSN
jgi:MFS family permease